VLPAIMEMSPQASFWFVEELENSCHNIGDTFSPEQSTRSLAFGKHILGKATQVRSKTSSSSVFVLRQNYLFEFQDWDNLASQPRGVAFLQDSIVSILNDTIKLEYYERSNKSRSKLKKVSLFINSCSCYDYSLIRLNLSYQSCSPTVTIEDYFTSRTQRCRSKRTVGN